MLLFFPYQQQQQEQHHTPSVSRRSSLLFRHTHTHTHTYRTHISHALLTRTSHTHISHAHLTRTSHTHISHAHLTSTSHTHISLAHLTHTSHTHILHTHLRSTSHTHISHAHLTRTYSLLADVRHCVLPSNRIEQQQKKGRRHIWLPRKHFRPSSPRPPPPPADEQRCCGRLLAPFVIRAAPWSSTDRSSHSPSRSIGPSQSPSTLPPCVCLSVYLSVCCFVVFAD